MWKLNTDNRRSTISVDGCRQSKKTKTKQSSKPEQNKSPPKTGSLATKTNKTYLITQKRKKRKPRLPRGPVTQMTNFKR